MKKSMMFMGMLSIGLAHAQTGKVGINTNNPQEILDVKGTVRIQELPESGSGQIYNGSDSKNKTFDGEKMVVTDDQGTLGISNVPIGAMKINVISINKLKSLTIPANSGELYKTPLSIQVPPGKWLYHITLGIQQKAEDKLGTNFVRLRFLENEESKNGASTLNSTIIMSKYKFSSVYLSQGFSFREQHGIVSGFLGLNNNTNETKTFHLYADIYFSLSGGTTPKQGVATTLNFNWSESSIIRIPAAE